MAHSQNRHKLSAISRREFIQAGAAFIGAAAVGMSGCERPSVNEKDRITIGMFADAHYADRAMKSNRYYRESLAKVEQCVSEFNRVSPDFVIQLGDFVDKGESVAIELNYLEQVESKYERFEGERHYVLGNHDVATFSKEQFISNCGVEKNYYSFNKKGFHLVILDACYNKDESDYRAGNFHWTESYIPSREREWLEADLQATEKKVIAFVHQRLDDEKDPHGVKNAQEIRKIFEESGNMLAVFQGHDHRGAYNSINDIHYYTLPALVESSGLENNAYAVVQIWLDGSINIKGFGKLESQELSPLG